MPRLIFTRNSRLKPRMAFNFLFIEKRTIRNKLSGCPGGARTHDSAVNSRVLYRLSYRAISTKLGVPTLHKALYSTTRAHLPMPGTLLGTTKISYFILHIYYNIFFLKKSIKIFHLEQDNMEVSSIQ